MTIISSTTARPQTNAPSAAGTFRTPALLGSASDTEARATRATLGLVLAALMAITASGCSKHAENSTPEGASGSATPSAAAQSLSNYYVHEKAGVALDQVPTATRTRLLEDLKRLQAAAAVGARNEKPDVANAIELSRLEILARSAAEAAGVYAPPTDAELQLAYQAYLQTLPASEFHAAHILVANEILANAVIAELGSGKSFAEVARERSADDSKSKGGDLGWIHPGHLPAEIFTALATLKPGQYTKTPVHTPYGWHVIELIEVRPASPPPFDQVKAPLATNLQQERYQKFLDDSLKASKNSR